jgi:septal ring factor EnvC (AmiA/AmiB activator)
MADQTAEIATFNLRLTNAEQDIKKVEDRFQSYVSQRENELQQREKELQLKNIEQTVARTENEQKDIKKDLKDLNDKIDDQGKKIDKLQIKGLTWIIITFVSILVSVIATVASSLIVYYLTRPGG